MQKDNRNVPMPVEAVVVEGNYLRVVHKIVRYRQSAHRNAIRLESAYGRKPDNPFAPLKPTCLRRANA